jgi:hypothetical protein
MKPRAQIGGPRGAAGNARGRACSPNLKKTARAKK